MSLIFIYLFISALLYLLIVHNFHIILLCVLINMRALLVNLYRYYFFINAQRWFIILYRYIMYLCTHTFPVSQSINYGMNFRKHVINSPWERLWTNIQWMAVEFLYNFFFIAVFYYSFLLLEILWINIQMNNLKEVEHSLNDKQWMLLRIV